MVCVLCSHHCTESHWKQRRNGWVARYHPHCKALAELEDLLVEEELESLQEQYIIEAGVRDIIARITHWRKISAWESELEDAEELAETAVAGLRVARQFRDRCAKPRHLHRKALASWRICWWKKSSSCCSSKRALKPG